MNQYALIKMGKRFSILDIYIIFWIIYYLQVVLLPTFRIVSLAILLINTSISIYCFFYANIRYKLPLYIKGLNLFFTLLSIYGVIRLFNNNSIITTTGGYVNETEYIKSIFNSILPIYTFYVFARKGYLTREKISQWMPFFFLACIIGFMNYKSKMALLGFDGEITNNGSYYFCSLLPTIVLIKNRKLCYFYLICAFFFILAGMKRGAILTGTLSIFFYFYMSFKTSSQSKKIQNLILIVVVFSIMVTFVDYFLSSSEYFVNRIEATKDGSTSGRNQIYSFFISHFLYDASDLQQLLGIGADGTLKIYGKYAHCDWLEVLTNQGMVGIFSFIVYWICLVLTIFRLRSNTLIKVSLTMFFIDYFLRSIFSMSILNMEIYSTISLGYCIAQFSNNRMIVEESL